MKGIRPYWSAVACVLALVVLSSVPSTGFAVDKERGRALYENHCTVCHTPKVHSRPNRIPMNVEEVRQLVANWAKEENLHWTDEEINDVVWYLNTTRYRYTH